MLIGYNTNGMANHDPLQAIQILGEIGYQSVALTIDHLLLNPFDQGFREQQKKVAELLDQFNMRSVIESGARFLLNPRKKHEPTLLASSVNERNRRIEFLKHCIDVARELDSDCVSIWSGAKPEECDDEQCLERLVESLKPVIEFAEENDIVLGFEPEPGMFIDTMASYQRLLQWIDSPTLKLTLDIGHLFCQGEVPIVGYIESWQDQIVNVHLEDMIAGRHEHLMFGDGEIYFPPIIEALRRAGYEGGLHVELSRHSHVAPSAARQAFEFLSDVLRQPAAEH